MLLSFQNNSDQNNSIQLYAHYFIPYLMQFLLTFPYNNKKIILKMFASKPDLYQIRQGYFLPVIVA